MDKKLVLGLDIGVGSVGWGIVEKESGKIVDKGVRLFSEIDPENNANRRSFRHLRRSLRRKEFRLYRTRRLLLEMGVINSIDFKPLDNPYQIRSEGLKRELNKTELATAILHLMKRNGFRYDIADDEEDSGSKTIKENYLCDHQLNLLKTEGKVRGIDNRYHFSLYEKEFLKLLDIQKVNNSYKEKLINIFTKRRHFSEGPGSANSPTPYGRYLTLGAEPINLIEKMRGHCSIYPNELRAPKICPSAELHNFLNDLNNLKINGNHISEDKKRDIFENYILGKGKITIRQLENEVGVSASQIDGFRLNLKGEPILTEFSSLKKIKEACKKNSLIEYDIQSEDDFTKLDLVFEALTSTKIVEERYEKIVNLGVSKEYAKAFSKISGVNDYHSLSLKAIYELNEEMFIESKNSQQIICTFTRDKEGLTDLKLPKDIIMSPVVYKAVNQTFKIVKAIIKQYGQLDSIIVEMAREKNSKDEKEKIKKSQENYLKNKEKVLEILNGITTGEIKGPLLEKVLLYIEQNAKSPYSGKSIDLSNLVCNQQAFEIDHIIPYSISLDDSRSNKVLVYASENQIKGQRSPYQMFNNNIPSDWWSFSEFEAYVRTNYKGNGRRKVENLLNKDDINNSHVKEGFIERNLNDTRYATRLVLNSFRSYFDKNNVNTKVFVINGATTHHVRVMANLHKDRNYYYHHAVDALIIASFTKSTYLSTSLNKGFYDPETGEVLSYLNDNEIFGPVVGNVCSQLINFDNISDYKFSYKIDTKPNRSLSDQTLYGTRYIDDELYAVKKYKNIYDEKDGNKLAQIIRSGKGIEDLLIYKNDKNSFALLSKIVAQYPENCKNPFLQYKNDNGEFIRKYSKNKKGPIIKSIKYIEARVNSCLDLSNKYFVPSNGKGYPVKLQLSPYRMDLYCNESGKYKFVTVRYANVRFKNNQYVINDSWYKEQKELKGIDSSYRFINSFYRGDLIKRIYDDGSNLLEVFKTVNNDIESRIELEFFGKETIKFDENNVGKKFQYMTTFSKKVVKVEKYSTDVIGNRYVVKNEKLKLKWQ